MAGADSGKRRSGSGAEADPAAGLSRFFRLLVEYDGTAYAGWQRQSGAPSVQQTLEEALEAITRHPVRCSAAGRTDAGVHALGQVARIRVDAPRVDAEALVRGTNRHLPADVRVVDARPCGAEFDPRRDARLRWYRYTVFHRPTAPALDRHRAAHVRGAMDWAAADRALGFLRGEHDFRAFRSSACTALRTRLDLVRAERTATGPWQHFDFRCRSFLHHMVRLLAGSLLAVARGRLPPESVRDFLESGERSGHFPIAPAQGLVLMGVWYPGDPEFDAPAGDVAQFS